MPKLVNTALDLASSGLEVAAVFVTGAAPIAPICKICLSLAPLAFWAVRSIWNSKNSQENSHVE